MLLWADPIEQPIHFKGSQRGGGVLYGTHAVRDFLQENSLKGIIRAHQAVDGIAILKSSAVVTVFSASNYDIERANQSGVLTIAADGNVTPHCYPPIERMQRDAAIFFSLNYAEAPSTGRAPSFPAVSIVSAANSRMMASGQFNLRKVFSLKSRRMSGFAFGVKKVGSEV
jgi:hypothetical protein